MVSLTVWNFQSKLCNSRARTDGRGCQRQAEGSSCEEKLRRSALGTRSVQERTMVYSRTVFERRQWKCVLLMRTANQYRLIVFPQHRQLSLPGLAQPVSHWTVPRCLLVAAGFAVCAVLVMVVVVVAVVVVVVVLVVAEWSSSGGAPAAACLPSSLSFSAFRSCSLLPWHQLWVGRFW